MVRRVSKWFIMATSTYFQPAKHRVSLQLDLCSSQSGSFIAYGTELRNYGDGIYSYSMAICVTMYVPCVEVVVLYVYNNTSILPLV